MLIQFDLNQNDLDALLRHCQSFQPDSGDAREDRRLADALEVVAEALMSPCQEPQTVLSDTGTILGERNRPVACAAFVFKAKVAASGG